MDTINSNKQNLFKKHLHRFTDSHEFLLELSILTTILVCLNFWSSLPDLGINPLIGKIIATLGILMIIGMVAFRFKWPLIVAMAGLMVYMGMSHLQIIEPTTTDPTATTHTTETGESSLGANTHYKYHDSLK